MSKSVINLLRKELFAVNPVLILFTRRTSLRVYKDEPIRPEHLQAVLTAAVLQAPTAGI